MREFPPGVWVEDVDLDILFKRDEGVCQLCHQPCSRKLASRDHIVPIARGGMHCYDNVQLAHKACNSYKGDKLEDELMLPNPWRRNRKGRTKPS